MLMPKAAMHKDDFAQAWKDEIRRARQVAAMQTVAITEPVRDLADDQFRLRVRLSNATHAGADFWRSLEAEHRS